jgi:TPR repeat protein
MRRLEPFNWARFFLAVGCILLFSIRPVFATEHSEYHSLDDLLRRGNAGDVQVQLFLGKIYYSGEGVESDEQESLNWYRKAAEQGNSDGIARMVAIYLMGLGVPKNPVLESKWALVGATKGEAWAQCHVGRCYAAGWGVPENYEEALKWLHLSARQNYAGAYVELGHLSFNGEGVKQNKPDAVRSWLRAAELGSWPTLQTLGGVYARGDGVRADYVEAYKWYSLALIACTGDKSDMLNELYKESIEAVPRLKAILSPSQLKKAQASAMAWWDRHKEKFY